MRKPNYGIDAPGLVRGFLVGAFILLAIGIALLTFSASLGSWSKIIAGLIFLFSLYPFGMFCLMNYESRIAKIVDREKILNLVNWRGNEQVLDVGCGRGLMLIGAAKRLTSGKAIGVDIWLERDQSSNHLNAPMQNAKIEGVEHRVLVKTADMRKLPFPDQTFDVVVSSWVLHNLEQKNERAIALEEMLRVLKPNETLLLTDIINREEYLDQLATLKVKNIQLIIFSPLKDRILRLVSFGSYSPTTIMAHKD
jgi:arsenite methyltransferase